MKKIADMVWSDKIWVSLVGIVLIGGFVSCSSEPEFCPRPPSSVELTLSDILTRAALSADRTKIIWQEGDAVSVFNDADNSSVKLVYSGNSKMIVTVPDGAENIFARYPYSEDAAAGPGKIEVSVPSLQTQTGPGVMNCGCYPLAASSPILDAKAELTFSPLASSLALVIYYSGLEGVEKVSSVRVTPTANSGFAGISTIDLTRGEVFSKGNSSDPVNLRLETPLELASSKPGSPRNYAGQLFVSLAKQSYTRLRFEISTDKHVYTIESNDTPIDLASCDIKILSIDLGKGKLYVENEVLHEGFEEDSDITENDSWIKYPIPIDVLVEDLDHDIIPDFSRVGYKYGDEDFPDYPNVIRVASPTGGDDTKLIQNAIDSAPASSVILLSKGVYKVSGIVFIDRNSIILRGCPEGTTILSTTKYKQPVINLGKTVGNREVTYSSPETVEYAHGAPAEIVIATVTAPSAEYYISSNIKEDYVPSGRLYVEVSEPDLFNIGDRVAVYRPGTSEWIHDIKMDQIPNHDGKQVQWKPSDYSINWERIITNIVGDRIYLDNPIVMSLDKKYGGGSLRRMNRPKVFFSGVENLTLDCEFDDTINGAPYYNLCDESHAWWGVRIRCAEHCWVKSVTTRHIGFSCVELGAGSKNVTVDDCHSLSPVSKVDGSRRYAFLFSGGTACLFSNCTCEADRHQFVTGTRNQGPDVFYNCTATSSYFEAGPHQRWATGVLYDNVTVDGDLEVIDGEWCGSGHGWRGANFVLWNCKAARLAVQSPWVSAKNYCVGGIGEKIHSSRGYQTFSNERYDGEWFPERSIGSTGGSVFLLPYEGNDAPDWFPSFQESSFTNPESLYKSQLEDRHARGIHFN